MLEEKNRTLRDSLETPDAAAQNDLDIHSDGPLREHWQ